MSTTTTIARFVARRNAELIHGTRLAATEFGVAYKAAYDERAAELKAKRTAMLKAAAPVEPTPRKQQKLTTA